MDKPQNIWIEQCDAACRIQEGFGKQKALGYLIGEKFMNFVKVADQYPEWAAELPAFAAGIKRIFPPGEIQEYLNNVRRVGALGHTCTDEEYEVFREADGAAADPAYGPETILLLERIKELLTA